MNKIVKVKTDGSLKLDVSTKLFKKVRKSQAWYMNRFVCLVFMLVFMVSDIAGFWRVAETTIADFPMNRFLISVGFSAAFELAPLYIGYAISLKCYDLGKKINKVIFSLSLSAFVLGIIINGIYRFMNIESMEESENPLSLTILLTVLPVITSLVNIVIGCLVFDPLYFDLIRIKRRLNTLQEKKRQLEAFVAELKLDDELGVSAKDDAETKYKNAKEELEKAKARLLNYADLISMASAP